MTGDEIKKLLRQYRLSQDDLSVILGIDRSVISLIINEKRKYKHARKRIEEFFVMKEKELTRIFDHQVAAEVFADELWKLLEGKDNEAPDEFKEFAKESCSLLIRPHPAGVEVGLRREQ